MSGGGVMVLILTMASDQPDVAAPDLERGAAPAETRGTNALSSIQRSSGPLAVLL